MIAPIPRHREIKNGTVRAACRQLEISPTIIAPSGSPRNGDFPILKIRRVRFRRKTVGKPPESVDGHMLSAGPSGFSLMTGLVIGAGENECAEASPFRWRENEGPKFPAERDKPYAGGMSSLLNFNRAVSFSPLPRRGLRQTRPPIHE